MSMHIERRVERLTTSAPGHLESHSTHRDLAHPCCTLQQLDPEDLQTTMCDLIQEDEKRLAARMDEETYKLHQQFIRAHGMPKGEFTTFSNGSVVKRNGRHDE